MKNLDVLRKMMESIETSEMETPTPIVAKRLSEYWKHYDACRVSIPFRPGDLIVPREDAPMSDRQVGIILELNLGASPNWNAGNVGSDVGQMNDIRVGFMSDEGNIYPIWSESHWFEPYHGATAA